MNKVTIKTGYNIEYSINKGYIKQVIDKRKKGYPLLTIAQDTKLNLNVIHKILQANNL